MANNITGASLNSIYERLNDAPEYHPLEADTFMDWSVEAGDVITVKRGDTEYNSPVQSTRMVWKGTPETKINSVGEKERESVSRTSKNTVAEVAHCGMNCIFTKSLQAVTVCFIVQSICLSRN